MDSLAAYLDSLEESGRFDSEGFFTLDLEKGSLKLKRHLLLNPEDYLLLAIRAGVAGGASSVKITLSYREAHLDFFMDEERLSEMRDGFVRPEDERPRAAQILHLSLGGAFDQGAYEAEISWPGWRLTANGETLKGQAYEGSPGVVGVTFKRSLGLFSMIGRTAREHRELSLRCAFSPVPVSLDGRELTGAPPVETLSEGKSGLPDGLTLVEGYLRFGQDQLSIRLSAGPVALVLAENSHQSIDRSWSVRPGSVFLRIVEPGFGAFFCLSRLYGKGQLQVVKDGVCLEPIESDSWLPGSRMVVRAQGVETDMTQLRPRDSQELEAILLWVTEQNIRLADQLHKNFPLLNGHPTPPRTKAALKAGGTGFLAGLAGGPLLAIFLGGAAALIEANLDEPSDNRLMVRVEQYLTHYRRKVKQSILQRDLPSGPGEVPRLEHPPIRS